MFGIARRVQLRHKRGAPKMNRLLFTLTVLVMMTAPGCALKCYVCSGNEDTCSKSKLEGDKDTYLKECPSGFDRCARSWSKKDDVNAVGNSCANEAACDAADELCDKLKDTIKDYKCGVGCCTDDACNAGSPVTFSFFLLIVSSVLGLALMK
ncbi:unnamed protein product [Pocillopora meandrina]|uniref:Uncharacterized protein n=1 Tax=Pocillopora meandrina TaxID=46732 RepID=A0AAU9XDY7_9CNID|nr:unnamed protein product [Pocillopora meandrina]